MPLTGTEPNILKTNDIPTMPKQHVEITQTFRFSKMKGNNFLYVFISYERRRHMHASQEARLL